LLSRNWRHFFLSESYLLKHVIIQYLNKILKPFEKLFAAMDVECLENLVLISVIGVLVFFLMEV